MAKMGTPIKTCDKQNHGRNDRHGNYKAFVNEAYQSRETGLRKCFDEDCDHDLTKHNIILGDLRYAEDICDFLEEKASAYRTHTKDGKKKKLRSNAKLCACGVVKGDCDYIDSLSESEQERFYRDAYDLISVEAERRGFHIITGVIHKDEYSTHLHYVGFDDNFQLSHKADCLPFKSWLNYTLPKQMAERGWNIQPNDSHYDAEYAKNLSDEELVEYKAKCRKEKKERRHGLSQEEYKAIKEQERILSDIRDLRVDYREMQKENDDLLLAKQEAERLLKSLEDYIDDRSKACDECDELARKLENDIHDLKQEMEFIRQGGISLQLEKFRDGMKSQNKHDLADQLKKSDDFTVKDIQDGLRLPRRDKPDRDPGLQIVREVGQNDLQYN